MFLGRERFATLLLMRLTETVILWLSEDQSFWDDIEEGPRPLGRTGLQQVCIHICYTIHFYTLTNIKTQTKREIKTNMFGIYRKTNMFGHLLIFFTVLFGYEVCHMFCIPRPLLISEFGPSSQ